MAPGDGVSLPTTLAQMGSVAKTQAKGQPGATQTAPVPEDHRQDEDLRVHRVKETEEAARNRIEPGQGDPDKRKRRRLRRRRKLRDGKDDPGEDPAGGDPETGQLGRLVDTRA